MQILTLTQKTAPTFNIAPVFTTSSDLAEKPPVSDSSKLHTKVVIASPDSDLETIITPLMTLSPSYEAIMLSVIPDAALSEEAYSALCADLNNLIEEKAISNIYLIAYPKDLKNLPLYENETISGIGIVIKKAEDLNQLHTFYHAPKRTKPLFIEDNIQAQHLYDVAIGIKTVYKLYYALAVKYPQVDTLLRPQGQNTAHAQYNRAYDNVLSKIQGTYAPIGQSTKLSGTHHLILWDDQDFFKDTAYVQYKWNDNHTDQSVHYPYPLTTDTTKLHDGINRLRVIGFDTANNVLWRKTMDVEVSNKLTPKRSLRVVTAYPKNQKPSYKGRYIPVLMYHSFAETVPKSSQSSYVTTKLFEQQLQALLKNNYTPVSFYDLHQYIEGKAGLPSKPIIITADDGYSNNYTHAYPLLKKYNIPATFFVSTAYVGINETTSQNTVHPHFSWEEALEMEKSGLIDIQIHGYDHTRFTKLSKEELAYQISISIGLIEKNLGKRDVVAAAYPEFKHNTSTVALLSKMGVHLQITDLARRGTVLQSTGIKRIHVSNTMSAAELISTLEYMTN
ncbi:polysaccharide deacetylase family protein [Cellulosilyticum sp. I15G10I2]|uniref:polysaccharide deacetylase family protein n=1 Tax=Cellulosilyticum sp. I15G10I2 TaxID=1892843 RepID=UPI001495AC20|nr:polysaccharide deacetylase family protein [Cellulosilyticum sp. I15G10I2]